MKSPFTGREMTVKAEKREIVFRKEPFTVDFHFYQCDKTGEEFTDARLGDLNMVQVFNKYRHKYNLPFPDEIKLLRERYELSASKMAEALGFGANVYRNYESGEIPSASNARLIQLAQDPSEFKKLVHLSGAFSDHDRIHKLLDNLITEEQEVFISYDYEDHLIGKKVANEKTGYKVPSLEKAMEMIVFFTNQMQNMGPLWKTKLNKLLFYSDFGHYKCQGYSISGLQYRAIQRGPVPSNFSNLFEYAASKDYVDIYYNESSEGILYEQFKPNSKKCFESDKFSPSELEILHLVSERFLKTSTKEIVDLSHNEEAWQHNHTDKLPIDYTYAFTLKNLPC